jgi:ATP-dependent helicase HrpA
VNVPHEVWRPQSLPDHLLMNFKVVDEAGKPIAAGRDLAELRVRLSADLKQTLANVPESPWHRDGITRWDFGDLPEKVQLERPGITLRGYPALVDREDSVSLRLMESPESAQRATRGGVRRLFALQLAHEIKYLSRSIRRIDEMCLHYATLGTCDELKRDLVSLIIDRALFGDIDDPVRTREQFADRAEAAWRNLGAESVRVSTLVGQILKAYHDLSVQLSKTFPPLLSPAIVDMRQHLGSLIQKGFVGQTPFQWLSQFPRFLRGIELRLQKLLDAGASRDAQAAAEIDLPWRAYQQKNQLLPADAPQREQLELYRWMIEELRISLFAQELKTSIPISRKRLSAQWSRIQG